MHHGQTMASSLIRDGSSEAASIPSIVPISYSYNTRGRIETISQGTNRTYTFGYDTDGDLVSITDPLTRTVGFDHNAVGQVTKQVMPDLREININHDENGNVKTIQPPSRPVHEFNYTAVNLEEDYIPPDIGIGPPQTHYDYNLDKQLTTVTRPDGKTIGLNYNATSGDLEQIVIPRGNIDFTYYPTTGYVNTITAPGNETLTFVYNGSFQTGTTFSGTISGTISRSYNINFQLESQTINGTDTISYGYDNDGLLTTAGPLTISRDPANGMITGTVLGNVTDTISYTDTLTAENYGEVANYEALYDTTSLYNVVYERDHLGRITKKTETIDGTTTVYEYTYYPTGWLHTVTKDGTLISTYTFDDNGNRLSYTPESGPSVTGTNDDQDRILTYGNATYTHTENGELLTKTEGTETTTYHYDVLGNLISVELPNGDLIEYIIDASNRRVGKKVNGTLIQGFIYDSQLHPIAELDGSGNVVAIFGPGFMVKGGTIYRFITDHLGSIRLIVDTSNGTIAQRIDYDEFGNVINDTNPGFQPFGFASGLYNPDTDLVRFGARDYDPETGRWTIKDPIRFSAGDTDLYTYCFNNPINLIDSSGLGTFSLGFSFNTGAGVGHSIGVDLIVIAYNPHTGEIQLGFLWPHIGLDGHAGVDGEFVIDITISANESLCGQGGLSSYSGGSFQFGPLGPNFGADVSYPPNSFPDPTSANPPNLHATDYAPYSTYSIGPGWGTPEVHSGVQYTADWNRGSYEVRPWVKNLF